MPTYEYACSSCKHEWELEQSIKEDPITECPSCHEATAKRQISRGTGFILKGSGWYADLYSSPSNNKPAETKDGGKKSDTPPSEGSGSTGSGSASGGTPSAGTPPSSSASAAA
jgi:putative FmdB family regulatory protein